MVTADASAPGGRPFAATRVRLPTGICRLILKQMHKCTNAPMQGEFGIALAETATFEALYCKTSSN